MEIDVNGRHAKICRSHQVPLVGTHSGNKNGIGNRINCSVVSDRKISYLEMCSKVGHEAANKINKMYTPEASSKGSATKDLSKARCQEML